MTTGITTNGTILDGVLEVAFGMIHGLDGTVGLMSPLDMDGAWGTTTHGIVHGDIPDLPGASMTLGIDGIAHITMEDLGGIGGTDIITPIIPGSTMGFTMVDITMTTAVHREET